MFVGPILLLGTCQPTPSSGPSPGVAEAVLGGGKPRGPRFPEPGWLSNTNAKKTPSPAKVCCFHVDALLEGAPSLSVSAPECCGAGDER